MTPRSYPSLSLLDAGEGRRLERLGPRVVDRPHPAATAWRTPIPEWAASDLRFDRGVGWSGSADPAGAWAVEATPGVTMELRPTPSGGVGIFPEQLENVGWLEHLVRERVDRPRRANEPPRTVGVLNLFAHTGFLTLVAAGAGAAVTHVDAARSVVGWARRNAELSGLEGRPIRWIVDDATAFTRREARRARRYDGLILDPPTYGHGGRGSFLLESGLEALLEAAAAVATPDAFILLSTHTESVDADRLLDALASAFRRPARTFETVALELVADTGAALPLGTAIRSRA